MLAAKAPSIQRSSDHERELKALVRAHSTPQKLAERARIVLLASDGLGVSETAQRWVSGTRRRATGAAVGWRREPPPAWQRGWVTRRAVVRRPPSRRSRSARSWRWPAKTLNGWMFRSASGAE